MADEARVVGDGGLRGTVLGPSDAKPDEIAVGLDDGREISVPSSSFRRQPDGTWHINNDWQKAEEAVVPVLSEDLNVGVRKRPVGKVRVQKNVTEHDETVSMPLATERAEVKRVIINRPVDGPLPVRREGDTIIMPVVEEVAVVEKRLMLKEEIRITRHRSTETHEETVTLRREDAVVERVDNSGNPLPVSSQSEREGLLGPRPKVRRVHENQIIKPD